MRILFITTAHNSLSQRLLVELRRRGHAIGLCVGGAPEHMVGAVERYRPDLVIAPMLKTAIPEQVWRSYRCLIVHPGITGDRGPSALDWALTLGVERWGVTVLQADAELDAGPIWAAETFALPGQPVTKSSLYRGEVTEAAVKAVLAAVAGVSGGSVAPQSLDDQCADVPGRWRPAMRQRDRAIDWATHTTHEIAVRVRAADSSPGVLTSLLGQEVYVYGAHEEDALTGPAGQVIGQRHGAVCVGTVDGAIWLTHARVRTPGLRYTGIKLPAAQILRQQLRHVPHPAMPVESASDHRTYRDIRYWEHGPVGYLAFDFYNGAMSTQQCRRLQKAFRRARARPTRIICLLGGRDFWSNGIHLNVIEAAADPARESWRNLNAMNDLVLQVLIAGQLVVAGLRGNAGAGGVMLALAADHVYARRGVVLNPHYRSMGNLHGSEYWTYTLPRRVGTEVARELTTACEPIGSEGACDIGLIDACFGSTVDQFERQLAATVRGLAADSGLPRRLDEKRQRRRADERARPLARYRAQELAHVSENFFGADASYHQARQRFVHKQPQLLSDACQLPLTDALRFDAESTGRSAGGTP
jgi:putative two-component system protein, hydrogenase maturation factor HypX/HoxX